VRDLRDHAGGGSRVASIELLLVVAAVAAGLLVAQTGVLALLMLVLLVTGIVAVSGGRWALSGILTWFALLPTQFVPPLRFAIAGLTLDPVKVLLVCVLLLVSYQWASRAHGSRGELPFDLTAQGWLTVAFVGMLLVSALVADQRMDALQWTAHWILSGLAVAVIIAVWLDGRGESGTRALLWSILGLGVLIGGYTLVESLLHANPVVELWLDLIYRAESTFTIARSAAGALPYKPYQVPYRALSLIGHPVFAATMMAPAAAVGVGVAATCTGWRKGIAFLAALVVVVGIMATGTRGSLLASGVGIATAVLSVARPGTARRGRRAIVAMGLAVALVVGLMLSGAIPAIGAAQRLTQGVTSSESFDHRLVTGTAALSVAIRHPVTGVGAGGFRRAYAVEVSGLDPISSIEDPARLSVDNMYLLAGADLGLLATALMVSLMVGMWRRFGAEEWGEYSPAFRGAVAAVAVSWFFADALYVASAAVLFWVLLGASGLVRAR